MKKLYPWNLDLCFLAITYSEKENIMEMYTTSDFIAIKQYLSKIIVYELPDYWAHLLIDSNLLIEPNINLWETEEVQCEYCQKFMFNICVYIVHDDESHIFCMMCYFTIKKHNKVEDDDYYFVVNTSVAFYNSEL